MRPIIAAASAFIAMVAVPAVAQPAASSARPNALVEFPSKGNAKLTVTTPANQTNDDGDSVSLTVTGSGSGSLSYSASGLPNGLSINSSTGVISGTISKGRTPLRG